MPPKGVEKRKAQDKKPGAEAPATLDALKSHLEHLVYDLSTKIDGGSRDMNNTFKVQTAALEKLAQQHYESTTQAQQAAAESMQVAGEAHGQAMEEVTALGKRLASNLQSATKSTLAATQDVTAQVGRSVDQLAAQHGSKGRK